MQPLAGMQEDKPRGEVMQQHNGGRLRHVAQEHPIVTVLGLGGLGLIGGIELAAGMLIGAGVAAALRIRRGAENEPTAHSVREKRRAIVDRMPHVVKERARAVIDAALGKTESPAKAPDSGATEHVSPPH